MNATVSVVLTWSFLGLIAFTGLCMLARSFFVSKKIRSILEICSVASVFGAFVMFLLAPDNKPAPNAKPLASIDSLQPGCYAIDEVWQVGGKSCAMIRYAVITDVNRVERTVTHWYSPTNSWILCDVTRKGIVGSLNPTKEQPFTSYALVERTNNRTSIRMYDPFH